MSQPTSPCCRGSSCVVARLSGALVARDCSTSTPSFDDFGFCDASGYAFVLQRLGDRERAERVLDAYLKYVADRPRLGFRGFGIADVEALALLGRRDEALARLREAIDAGWRTPGPGTAGTLLTIRISPSCATTLASARSWPRSTPTSPGCASAPRRPRRAATGSRCSRLPRRARDASRQPRAIDAASHRFRHPYP